MDLPKTTSFQKLLIYQKAKSLTLFVYQLTKKLPKEEMYVLVPQMRRSAISVMANIGEGYAKNSTKEFIRFINISIGSLIELEIYADLIIELEYINNEESRKFHQFIEEMKKLLYSTRYTLGRRVIKARG